MVSLAALRRDLATQACAVACRGLVAAALQVWRRVRASQVWSLGWVVRSVARRGYATVLLGSTVRWFLGFAP